MTGEVGGAHLPQLIPRFSEFGLNTAKAHLSALLSRLQFDLQVL